MEIHKDIKNIKISSYTSGFNLIKNEFNWEKALTNHSFIADEIVVAINSSEDDTYQRVLDFSTAHNARNPPSSIEDDDCESCKRGEIKIIETAFSYLDPDLDGKIKNAALQATSHDIKLGLDMDELIDPKMRSRLREVAASLVATEDIQAFFVPVIDLYKNKYFYKGIGQKWYLHKKDLYRGTVNFARRPDGTHNTDQSDSCELIDEYGNLVRSVSMVLVDGSTTEDVTFDNIVSQNIPVVFHTGYLNLEKKVLRNKNFWKNHWSIEAGRPVYVPTDVNEMDYPAERHNLNVDFI